MFPTSHTLVSLIRHPEPQHPTGTSCLLLVPPWCLRHTREKSAYHHSARSKGKCLDDVPGVTSTTIRNDRSTELERGLGNSEHCCGLWMTDGHHLLRARVRRDERADSGFGTDLED